MYWISTHGNDAMSLHVDDGTRQRKAYQNTAVVCTSGNKQMHHVISVGRISDKKAETKFEDMQQVNQYYKTLGEIINWKQSTSGSSTQQAPAVSEQVSMEDNANVLTGDVLDIAMIEDEERVVDSVSEAILMFSNRDKISNDVPVTAQVSNVASTGTEQASVVEFDFLCKINSYVSDRCSTETKMFKMIEKYQEVNGKNIKAKHFTCGTHLFNTCTQDAQKARANFFHTKRDSGYECLAMSVREIKSNPRAKSFIYDEMKEDFTFRDTSIARFYQNMIYSSDIIKLIPTLKKLVALELEGIELRV
ncbi:MAG: hypothetical protein ACK4IX_12195, partial [Candidatus Sericytochromatia bacterium]